MPRAIPISLLIHNCILKKQSGLDRNRNQLYEHTILKQVRIGGTFKSIRGTYGETQFDALTLLIDEQNTRYENVDGEAVERKLPEEKDVIEWQGKAFTVRSITPCYTHGQKPHHWEVTLE